MAVDLNDSLRWEPEWLGLVTAHEVLHLLGLFHTTESFLEWYGVDPIADTAACPPERDADGDQFLDSMECAGLDGMNLMFQDAPLEDAEVTAGQRRVVALSPLTY